jgi:hypothetical protein
MGLYPSGVFGFHGATLVFAGVVVLVAEVAAKTGVRLPKKTVVAIKRYIIFFI